MGFNFLGQISEACKKQFKENIEEIAKLSVSGFSSENPRVRYEAMQATGLLLNDLAPTFQTKFHGDLLPVFIKMLGPEGETHLKLQTQVMACLTSFVRGLIDEESAEDSETNLA